MSDKTQFQEPEETQFQAPGETQRQTTRDQAKIKTAEEAVPLEWHRGDVILDIYEVQSELGGGGFGVVHKVRHRGWDVEMAVKSPRAEALTQAGGVDAVVQEAQTWMDLGLHPHIVTCHYVRTLGGVPRVFAEYVDGGSLKDWIEAGRLTTLDQILDAAIQFAWGLAYANSRGLIHRDVKPANVMMTKEGAAKVTDFGLARARPAQAIILEDFHKNSVEVSTAYMTPAYCSPEQAEIGMLAQSGVGSDQWPKLTPATDIWSWAISILEIFVGELTWSSGQAAPYVLEAYLEGEMGNPDLPPMPDELANLLKSCFEINPVERSSDFELIAGKLIELYKQAAGYPYGREDPRQLNLRADALNNRALSMYDLGRVEAARQMWEEALQAEPSHFESQYNLALLNWRSGKIEDHEMLSKIKNLAAENQNDWRRAHLTACVQIERLHFSEARTILEHLVQEHPEQSAIKRTLEILNKQTTADYQVTAEIPTGFHEISHIDLDAHEMLAATTSSGGGELKIWDLKSKKCIQTITTSGHFYRVKLNTPMDMVMVLTESDQNGYYFYEISTGNLAGIVPLNKDGSGHALAANGRYMMEGGATPHLWDLTPLKKGGKPKCAQVLPEGMYELALSADGRWVFGCQHQDGNDFMVYYDLKNQRLKQKFAVPGKVYFIYLDTEGHHAISLHDNPEKWWDADKEPTGQWGIAKVLVYWDLTAGVIEKEVTTMMSGSSQSRTFDIAFSPEQRLGLSINQDPKEIGTMLKTDNFIKLWDLETGRVISSTTASSNSIRALSISGILAALGGKEPGLKLINLDCAQIDYLSTFEYSHLQTVERTQEDIKKYAQLMEQTRQALVKNDFITATQTLREARQLSGYEQDERAFDLWQTLYLKQPITAFKTAYYLNKLGMFFFQSAKLVNDDIKQVLALEHGGGGGVMRFSSGDIKLLDGASGEVLLTIEAGESKTSFDISLDGSEVLIGTEGGRVYLWSLERGKRIREYKIKKDNRRPQVILSPDQYLLFNSSVFADVSVMDKKKKRLLAQMQGLDKGSLLCVCLNRSANKLLLGLKDNSVVWDLITNEAVSLPVPGAQSACFSPDDRLVFLGRQDGKIIQFEIGNGALKEIEAHTKNVTALALSSDGQFLLSGSDDGTARLWDEEHNEHVWAFTTPGGAGITDVGLSRDGRYAFVVAGAIHIWQLDWELGAEPLIDWDANALPHLHNFTSWYFRDKPNNRQLIAPQKKPKINDQAVADAQRYLAECGFGYLTAEGIQNYLSQIARRD